LVPRTRKLIGVHFNNGLVGEGEWKPDALGDAVGLILGVSLDVLVSQGDTACSRRYGNLLYLLIDV
jgi:hypothetical protein